MPTQVWLKQDSEGRDEALQIEWFGGKVLVRFSSAALPETADNVLAREAKAFKDVSPVDGELTRSLCS